MEPKSRYAHFLPQEEKGPMPENAVAALINAAGAVVAAIRNEAVIRERKRFRVRHERGL
jgi:hypothetical protein